MQFIALLQAALEAERLTLQSRLKSALKPRMVPKTTLDTASPIDKAVTLLESLLEVMYDAHALLHASAVHTHAGPGTYTVLERLRHFATVGGSHCLTTPTICGASTGGMSCGFAKLCR